MTTPDPEIAELATIRGSIDHWHLSQQRKNENVASTQADVERYVAKKELDMSPALQQKIVDQYKNNAREFSDKIPGPVHDEQHLAFVTHWATEIYPEQVSKLPQEKKRLFGIAYIVSAIEHDIGDVPTEGKTLAESLKHEEKSVSHAKDFIDSLPDLTDDEKEELKALSSVMIIGTSPQVNLPPYGVSQTIDELKISRGIEMAYDEQSVDFTKDAKSETVDQLKLFAKTVEEGVTKLKDFGWQKADIINAQRLMTSADYSAYLGNPSIMEPAGLWVELNSLYYDPNGMLKSGQAPSFENWMSPNFRDNIYHLYGNTIPQSLNKIFNETQRVLSVFQEENKNVSYDRLYRLEGGLAPIHLLGIVNKLSAGDFKVNQIPEIQKALFDYGQSFVRSFEAENSDFSSLATKTIVDIFKSIPDTEPGIKSLFIIQLFEKIDENLKNSNDRATLHFAPLAYPEDFTKEFFRHRKQAGGIGHPEITNIGITLRLGVDNDPEKIKGVIQSAIDSKPDDSILRGPDPIISLGGQSSAERLTEIMKVIPNERLEVIIHAGYYEKQDSDSSNTFLDTAAGYGTSDKPVSIHLDKNPQHFVNWINKLKSENRLEEIKGKIKVLISPLAEIIRHPEVVDLYRQIADEFDVAITSNNSPTMAGGAGISMVNAFAKSQIL